MYLRHAAFWLAWVLGFTFVKSVGQDLNEYVGWLIYYIITLPVFMAHTYFIAYWAIPELLKRWKSVLFVFVFLGSVYVFSVLEILITQNLLEQWFPSVFMENISIRNPMSVMVSGVGNLYIVLVFIATRLVRKWYIADEIHRKLEKRKLELTKAETKAAIQPNMLLHAVGAIEQMAEKKVANTSTVIAELSELLGSLMQAKALNKLGIDEELQNVKKLCKLYHLIYKVNMPRLLINLQNPEIKLIPAFMVFSPLEIVFRTIGSLPDGVIDIMIVGEREVLMDFSMPQVNKELTQILSREVDQLFPGRYFLSVQWEKLNCMITVRELHSKVEIDF